MCGRFNNHLPKMLGWAEMLSEWGEQFYSELNQEQQIRQSYNVTPSSTIAVYADLKSTPECDHTSSPADQELVLSQQAMRWGMIPGWSNTFESKYATFNARVESIDDKATFRSAWKQQRRCLIPMAGYYEWQAAKEKGSKQPFYITDKNVGGLIAAGLYEQWGGHDDGKLSCTMITRAADPGLDSIHGRMPILLTPESAQQWLECEPSLSKQLLIDMASPDLVYWPVSTAVGNVRNDVEELCAPIDLIFD